MHVKSLQSYPTLYDPMDCSLPRFLCLWDFPGKNTGVGCRFLLQGIFLIQGSNPRVLHWQVDSSPTEPPRKPYKFPANKIWAWAGTYLQALETLRQTLRSLFQLMACGVLTRVHPYLASVRPWERHLSPLDDCLLLLGAEQNKLKNSMTLFPHHCRVGTNIFTL